MQFLVFIDSKMAGPYGPCKAFQPFGQWLQQTKSPL